MLLHYAYCIASMLIKHFLFKITSFPVRRFLIRFETRSEQRSRVCVRRRQGAQRARARPCARHRGPAPVTADHLYAPRRRGDGRRGDDGDYAGQLRATRLLARLLSQGRVVHRLHAYALTAYRLRSSTTELTIQ